MAFYYLVNRQTLKPLFVGKSVSSSYVFCEHETRFLWVCRDFWQAYVALHHSPGTDTINHPGVDFINTDEFAIASGPIIEHQGNLICQGPLLTVEANVVDTDEFKTCLAASVGRTHPDASVNFERKYYTLGLVFGDGFDVEGLAKACSAGDYLVNNHVVYSVVGVDHRPDVGEIVYYCERTTYCDKLDAQQQSSETTA